MTATELLATVEKILEEGFGAITDELAPELKAAFAAGGISLIAELGLKADLRGMVNRQALRYAEDHAAELLKDFAETTPEMMRATITQAIEERWGAGKLRETLNDNYAFGGARALMIARTELARAARHGTDASARASGVVKMKRWDADEMACVECMANAGQGWIALDDEFVSGADPHPGCTCGVRYSLDDEPDDDDEPETGGHVPADEDLDD